jgi:precorrin-6B methylase 2
MTMKAPEWAETLRQEHVDGARLMASRHDMLSVLEVPEGGVIAEVGVEHGNFSLVLIERLKPREFHAFDLFPMSDQDGLRHVEWYRRRLESKLAPAQVRIYEGDSSTELAKRPDESYDLIYIDGDHTYEGVFKDAHVSLRKIKRDGLLVFNDYKMQDHFYNVPYGVVHVVNDLCVNHGFRMTHFALENSMFCDVVLRRAS